MATQDPFAWQAKAKCTSMASSKFFLDEERSDHDKDAYKAICKLCPVRWECLETGIVYNFEGVWGGLDHKDRRKQYSKDYRNQLILEREEAGTFTELDKLAA
jgi:hypothetical protein